jgi:hypothetical protein
MPQRDGGKVLWSEQLSVGSQMTTVWLSTKIGAGRVCGKSAENPYHETYIVVNFSPAGNMAGAYKDNVPPPT